MIFQQISKVYYEFQKFKAKIESFLEGVSVDTESLSAMNKFEVRKDVKVQVVEGFFPFPNVGNCLLLNITVDLIKREVGNI